MRGKICLGALCFLAIAIRSSASATGQSTGAAAGVEVSPRISQADSSSTSSGSAQNATPRYEDLNHYTAATNRFSSTVRLSPDGRSLEGYTAGMPFPLAGSNRPRSWYQEQVQQLNEQDAEREAAGLDPERSKGPEAPELGPQPNRTPR